MTAGGWDAVLIAGPTASGKSRLALELARAHGGTIVNADSMQVYDGLAILTARPDAADLAAAPHRLYGHVDPRDDYSAGAWVRDVASVLDELRADGRLPIVCGGTGLYFRALLGGLDAMPAIDPGIRAGLRARMEAEGPAALHEDLRAADPDAAARIAPADRQRVLRALELIEATGRPLAAAQAGRGEPLVDEKRTLKLLLTPERTLLRRRIGERFAAMIEAGAIEEVRAFRERFGRVEGTAGRAIGLAEIGDYLDGRASLDAAALRAVTRTRQYAKRQETWFRNQFDETWRRLDAAATADSIEF